MSRNRIQTAANPYQGERERVLCVCSAGLLRSPTLAYVLQQEPYNKNTRAVGSTPTFALVKLDEVLIAWAQTIVFVNRENLIEASMYFSDELEGKEIITLDIPDEYEAFDPKLIEIIKEQLNRFDYI
jgi:predicted protein tyrosine phosphatase